MALMDEVAMIGEIDLNKHSDYVNTMIPILLEFAETKCNNTFDEIKPPAGIKIFIAESIKHKLNNKGLKARSMGSVTYTYDTELPDKIVKNLNPYKKVRFK